MDIFKQLDINKIPGVADFGRVEIPASQRVQAYLAGVLGGAWESAYVISWVLPTTGERVHAAFLTASGPGPDMRLVSERDGHLFQAIPLETGDDPDELRAEIAFMRTSQARDEQPCLDQILPALIRASDIVARSAGVTQKERKRLCYQLGHAAKHLFLHFEQKQNREKGSTA